MNKKKEIYLVGYASDIGAATSGSAKAPQVIKDSFFLKNPKSYLHWVKILNGEENDDLPKIEKVARLCQSLSDYIYHLTENNKFFVVIGGDHSSAVGTWSGLYRRVHPFGLIWIDAHMDCHTPITSETGNIHGMPLASLLGFGTGLLTNVGLPGQKLLPEHVCLIGARSFESGEENLIKKLNIKVFYMNEVKERGLKSVFEDALRIVNNGTKGFGVSFDIDALDPLDAPGTGVKAPNGINSKAFLQHFKKILEDKRLFGLEIVEFDPTRDTKCATEKIVTKILSTL